MSMKTIFFGGVGGVSFAPSQSKPLMSLKLLLFKYFGPHDLVWQSAGSIYDDCAYTRDVTRKRVIVYIKYISFNC